MSVASPARRRTSSAVSRVIESLETRRLFTSVANKIADINQTTSYLTPTNFTPVGNVTYFTGKSAHGDGEELWITDGTTAGTRRVKDINPGSASSNPTNLFAAGSILYFSADDGVHGSELWKSDGTEAGTVMVKDLNPGSANSTPGGSGGTGTTNGMVLNNDGKLYFIATDASGTSLFKTDGTDVGTSRLTTTNYSFASRVPLAAMNGSVYFGAISNALGQPGNGGLFRTNTSPAAGPIVTVRFFQTTTKPSNLTVLNNKVYFSADQDSSNKGDLWSADGVSATLVSAVGTASYSTPVNFRRSGGLIYFVNYEQQTGKTELWRTDGSNTGTLALSTTLSLDRTFNPFVAWGTTQVLFTAGGLVYRSDGTPSTTTALTGFASGTTATSITGAGGRFYVTATKADGYQALYSTDASALTLVQDLGTDFFWSAGSLNNASSNTPDFLFARTFTAGLGDLWRSNGTSATTTRIGTSNASATASSMFDYYSFINETPAFVAMGSSVVFAADDGVSGSEVWITNPTTGVTRLLADVNAGSGSSNPNGFTYDAQSGVVYFQAFTPSTGTELYRILPGGTVQIASNVATGTASSNPHDLRFVGSNLYFTARTNATNYLLRYNPSNLTTSQTLDGAYALINSGPVLVNGTTALVTAANVSTNTKTLYKLNGIAAPTPLISGLEIESIGWGDKMSVNIGSVTYFVGYEATAGAELWRSDGTPAGTYRLSDVMAGSGDANIRELTSFGGRVYFNASTDSGLTNTLWTSDGTPAGTTPYAPAAGFTAVSSVIALANNMQMIATGPDGTTSGIWTLPFGTGDSTPTLKVAATATAKPQVLVSAFGGSAFYVSLDDTGTYLQYSLYKTSTTVGGASTFVKDLWTYNSYDVTMSSRWGVGHLAFLQNSNRLYFPAFRPEWGMEPHSYVLDTIATTISGPAYVDANGNGTRETGELAAVGANVFVDLDNDGVHDADEPTALTNVNGVWAFNGLELANTYVVRLLPDSGFKQTEPVGNASVTRTISTSGVQSGSSAFGLAESVAPTVASIIVDRDASVFTIRAIFSEAINVATLAAGDLSVKLPDGSTVSQAQIAFTYDAATRTAAFTFPGLPNGMPPTGWLSAFLNAGVFADTAGNTNTASGVVTFTALPGDANDDHIVDFSDLLTLAKNYGKTGLPFSQGNFDYDSAGTVDFNDLLILAKAYGTSLGATPPAATVMAAATPAAATRKRATADVLA